MVAQRSRRIILNYFKVEREAKKHADLNSSEMNLLKKLDWDAMMDRILFE